MWTRKKKKKSLKESELPEGVTLVSTPEAPQLEAAGITDSHVVASEEGVRLVYWQDGEYHDALIPAVLVPSFYRVMTQSAGFYGKRG
jgi:hypothetical protein